MGKGVGEWARVQGLDVFSLILSQGGPTPHSNTPGHTTNLCQTDTLKCVPHLYQNELNQNEPVHGAECVGVSDGLLLARLSLAYVYVRIPTAPHQQPNCGNTS